MAQPAELRDSLDLLLRDVLTDLYAVHCLVIGVAEFGAEEFARRARLKLASATARLSAALGLIDRLYAAQKSKEACGEMVHENQKNHEHEN